MKTVLITIFLVFFTYVENANARRTHVWFVEKVDPSLIRDEIYRGEKPYKTKQTEYKQRKKESLPKKIEKSKLILADKKTAGSNSRETYTSKNKSEKGLYGLLSEVRLGIGDHDAGVFGRTKEEGLDFNIEFLFLSPDFLEAIWSPRPMLGASMNSDNDTSQVYAGITWEGWFYDNFFWNFGFGLSFHDGETKSDNIKKKELGSKVLFRESIDIGWAFFENNQVSLFVDHMSHGHIFGDDKNEGMDTIGIRYGYRFW